MTRFKARSTFGESQPNLISISNLLTGCGTVALLYSRATVDVPSVAKPKRWQVTIAILAALCLLVAVLGGNPLRAKLVTAATTQSPATLVSGSAHSDRESLSGTTPANHVSFKSAAMKRNRQPSWARVDTQSVSSLQPIILPAFGFQSGDAHPAARATAALGGQDILTQLCTARR